MLGENVTLNCTAKAQPPPEYTWFIRKGTKDIALENETSPELTFRNLVPSKRGAYFCNVSNELGAIMSPLALLSIEGKHTLNLNFCHLI